MLDGPRASAPGEVVVADGWYTYDAKYADESSRFDAPADLTPAQAERVRRLAETAFPALALNGLARIDFFLDAATGEFVFNEANTMPGFTSISGFPKMWDASGMSYPQLCDHLVRAAIITTRRVQTRHPLTPCVWLRAERRAGERTNDAGDRLDVVNHEVTQRIDVGCFGRHDDVVGPGHGFGGLDAVDRTDRCATSEALPESVWMRTNA